MKITTTITNEVERADGSYTKTVERRDHTCGDNPRFETAERAKAIDEAVTVMRQRIEADARPSEAAVEELRDVFKRWFLDAHAGLDLRTAMQGIGGDLKRVLDIADGWEKQS